MPDWLVYILAYTFGSMFLGFCFVHGAFGIKAIIENLEPKLTETKHLLITYWIVGSIALTLWVSW